MACLAADNSLVCSYPKILLLFLSLILNLSLIPGLKSAFSVPISVSFWFGLLLLDLASCRIGIFYHFSPDYKSCFSIFDSQWMLTYIRWITVQKEYSTKDTIIQNIYTELCWRLVIFPMAWNNTFEASGFEDPRFSYGKNYCETWNKWFRIFYPNSSRFNSFWLEKNQTANSGEKKPPRCIN